MSNSAFTFLFDREIIHFNLFCFNKISIQQMPRNNGQILAVQTCPLGVRKQRNHGA